MNDLSGEGLVDGSGVTAEQLRRLVDLGIVTPTPQGRYRRSDIQRIRVVDALADAGHPEHSWSDDLDQVAASLIANLERTAALLYRRHFEHYVLDVTLLRAEVGLERAGLAQRALNDLPPSPSWTSPATPSSPRNAATGPPPSWSPAWLRSSTNSPTATAVVR